MLHDAALPIDAMRKISIIKSNENSINLNTLTQKIRSITAQKDIKITYLNAERCIMKCPNNTVATQIEEALTALYPHMLQFSIIKPEHPQIKIVGIDTESLEEDTLAIKLKVQNDCMNDKNFAVQKVYRVNTPHKSYTNAIIECTLELQNTLLSRNFLKYGHSELKIYEHINVVQCSRCFGHLSKACTNPRSCRRCTGNHSAADCPSPNNIKCANCDKAKNNKTANKHKSNDECCPVRADRIRQLKEYLHAKKK